MILFLVVLTIACIAGFTIIFPRVAMVSWLLLLESSPDMWLDRLLGYGHHEMIVGLAKGFGLALSLLLMLRHGARRDRYNPAFAFGIMFLTGLMHGLWPGLTLLASLRSLIGSAGPFLFSFCKMPANFIRAALWAILWGPLCVVGFGAVLAALGLGHMYVLEQGAMRLGATGEPPFLAGFALVGIYAGLLEFLAAPSLTLGGTILLNFLIILLTGARAPLFLACLSIFALLFLQGRVLIIATAGALFSAAVLFSSWLSFIRVIDLTRLGEASSLSNRDLIWPYFQKAFQASPIFGWGVGAGKVIVPVTSTLDALLGTNAAHDEYLRIGCEGGAFGLLLLISLFTLWVKRGSLNLPAAQRWLIRLMFIGFAIHSATDNTLIATTSSVFFLWTACVFAKAQTAGIFAKTENATRAAA